MLRAILAAFAALLASACAYGSAVDMAPMKDRISKPVIPQGAYCETQQTDGAWHVISSDDCAPIVWNRQTRTYTMEDDGENGDAVEAAVVRLAPNLYLAQVVDDSGPVRFQIQLLLAKGEALAVLPVLGGAPLKALAARHPRVTFHTHRNRPYIAAGKPQDIRAFLKEAAREALRGMYAEGETLDVGVKDTPGAADHPASRAQVKNIEAILKAARELARE